MSTLSPMPLASSAGRHNAYEGQSMRGMPSELDVSETFQNLMILKNQ